MSRLTTTTQAGVRIVTPIVSSSSIEAKRRVLALYKKMQRILPQAWLDYGLKDIPLPVFRAAVKSRFQRQAHLTDPRVIDRKVSEGYKDIESIRYYYYNTFHLRNMLFPDNLNPRPRDFLSQFLSGK